MWLNFNNSIDFHNPKIKMHALKKEGRRKESCLARTWVFTMSITLFYFIFFLWSVDQSLLGSKPGGLLSAAAIPVTDKVYIFGGFNGQTQASLFRLTLPSNLCQAITSQEKCVAAPTCSWCKVYSIMQQGNTTVNVATNQSACYSVSSSVPGICQAEPNVTQASKIQQNVMNLGFVV